MADVGIFVKLPGILWIRLNIRNQWAKSNPTTGVFMTCMATSGNGAWINISILRKKGVVNEPEDGDFVIRGDAYNTYPKFCRSACIKGRHEFRGMSDDFYRTMYSDHGFRVVLNRVK